MGRQGVMIAHPEIGASTPSGTDTNLKEDWVREEVTYPLLIRLGYASSAGENRIIRSRALAHPFVMIGTTQHPVTLIPDYLLSVSGKYSWVLDAKAPSEKVLSGPNIQQIYSYAIHPEIRAKIFVLCNGEELVIYSIDESAPLHYGKMHRLEENWRQILSFLAPRAFRKDAHRPTIQSGTSGRDTSPFDYSKIIPVKEITSIQKQTAKRHHGVHGYFTRQVW
jgi:hypothetical protein